MVTPQLLNYIAKFFVVVSTTVFFLCHSANAQFVKSGKTYQTDTIKVVVADKERGEQRGLFLLNLPPPGVPVQLFDLPNTKLDGTKSIFLALAGKGAQFSTLRTPTKSYSIRGSFTLLLGRTRVTLDMVSNATPYLSITDLNPLSPAILGFAGTTVAVNSAGLKAAALLEASIPEAKGATVEPYTLSDDGTLKIGETPVLADWIGVQIQSDNICQNSSTITLNEGASAKLLAALQSQNDNFEDDLKALVESKTSTLNFGEIIILRQSAKEGIVAFEYASGNFLNIRPLTLAGPKGEPLAFQRAICVSKMVKFDD
jgi:hypothetical protein